MNKKYLKEFNDTLKANYVVAQPPPLKINLQH